MMEKLKVAVFNTQPPHLYFGGVERRIVEVAKRLTNVVDTNVFCGTKKGFSEVTEVDGTTFVPCFSTDMLYPLDNWVFNHSISQMVGTIKADIYEAHTVSGYKFLKKLRKHDISKPFIQTVHGVLEDEYIQSFRSESLSLRMKLSKVIMKYLAGIEKEAAKKATLVVTVSRYSAKKIIQLYEIEESKIRIVPNGVDTQKFKPVEDYQEVNGRIVGNSRHLILFVGNLIPRKGLHFLIEAAKYVIKENANARFVVVGDGPLKNHLVTYSKEQGVSKNFIFLGNVPEAMLHQLYNSADLFASPSIQEGQGITLLEAQSMAMPVVAFDISAISEVVKNNETGLLVKPDSYELANAISHLLSNPDLRKKMGRSGREFVTENFSWDVLAQNMFRVYSETSGRI